MGTDLNVSHPLTKLAEDLRENEEMAMKRRIELKLNCTSEIYVFYTEIHLLFVFFALYNVQKKESSNGKSKRNLIHFAII